MQTEDKQILTNLALVLAFGVAIAIGVVIIAGIIS